MRPSWITIGMVIAALAVHVITPLADALRFERLLMDDEPWRLFACHLVHFNTAHLFWNCLVFAVAGTLLEQRSSREFVITVGVTIIAIGPGLILGDPGLGTYCGLSGIGAACIASVAYRGVIDRANRTIWLIVAFLLISKITMEFLQPQPLLAGDTATFRSVPLAHAIGILAGVLSSSLFRVRPSDTDVGNLGLDSLAR